jgi:TM2 domain-containing membrane protein YozV
MLEGVPSAPRRRGKNPWLALVLSLLVTGVGQIYVGRITRGLAFLGGVLLISFALDGYMSYDQIMLIGAALSVISAVDAYRLAKGTQSKLGNGN